MRWIFYESPLSGRMLSILRIVAGIIFVSYGTMKLFGYPPSPTPIGPIDLNSQLGIAGMLEVVGGLAIVFGLLTRPVAFVLCGEMAVAYFQAHFPRSPLPTVNNGVPAVLYCVLFLYFAFAGAGAWSIDALIARMATTSLPLAERRALACGDRRVVRRIDRRIAS
jgi:putative oxidoreductase